MKGYSVGRQQQQRSGGQTLALEPFCVCLHAIQTKIPSQGSPAWSAPDQYALAHWQLGNPILSASSQNELWEAGATGSAWTAATTGPSSLEGCHSPSIMRNTWISLPNSLPSEDVCLMTQLETLINGMEFGRLTTHTLLPLCYFLNKIVEQSEGRHVLSLQQSCRQPAFTPSSHWLEIGKTRSDAQ